MRRGEVYWARLRPRSGSEQRGTRPVVVVSHDSLNRAEAWRSIIVVPLTTSPLQARRGPTAVPVPAAAAGLEEDSTALCHQVTTLDRAKLFRRAGTLPVSVLEVVEEGLRIAMDL